jgi:nucleoside-diphosphate-sugar epimerase
MRIAVTGGSGTIGNFTVRELQQSGHEVRNFDAIRPSGAGVSTSRVDVTNLGDLVSCLNGYEAIVHLAAIVAPGRTSNNEIFRVNAQSTFNVLEAASILGIKHVVLASSINAVGMHFNVEPRFQYLPLDEDHCCGPDEAYGLSKRVGEITADGFALRFPDMTISSLRYPAVITPERYPLLEREADHRHKILWAWADVREIARANRLAVETTRPGHEVYFLTADHTMSMTPSMELVAQWFPGIDVRAEITGCGALISSRKAAELLRWKHERDFETELRSSK